MELSIKNMVCGRCIKTVTVVLKESGLHIQSVQLGKAIVDDKVSKEQISSIRQKLAAEGFDLLDDQRGKLVEKIKNEIVSLVHYGGLDEMRENLSDFLSDKLHKDYNYLSNLFSSVKAERPPPETPRQDLTCK